MQMRAVQKLLAPLRRRLAQVVTRAVISLVNDSPQLQEVQAKLLAGEALSDVERFQEYGFTSVPHAGAEGIALSACGHRSHTVVVAVDDRRYRLKAMEKGEVALYTDEGDMIHLGRGRIIRAVTETFRVEAATLFEVLTPAFSLRGSGDGSSVGTITGSLAITGDVTTGGDVTSDGDHVAGAISLQSHVHGGVESGGDTTGAPE